MQSDWHIDYLNSKKFVDRVFNFMAKYYRYSSKFWIGLFPELSLFDDVDDREEAFRAAVKRIPWFMLLTVPFAVLFVDLVIKPGIYAFSGHLPFLDTLAPYICGGLMGLLLGPGSLYICRGIIRRKLRTSLNAQGIPVCMSCGYCLRGLEEPRCPECGQACQADVIRSEEKSCNEN